MFLFVCVWPCASAVLSCCLLPASCLLSCCRGCRRVIAMFSAVVCRCSCSCVRASLCTSLAAVVCLTPLVLTLLVPWTPCTLTATRSSPNSVYAWGSNGTLQWLRREWLRVPPAIFTVIGARCAGRCPGVPGGAGPVLRGAASVPKFRFASVGSPMEP